MNQNFLKTKEAAEYIGYSVSGFKKLVYKGIIPYTKPAGRLFFYKKDLDGFLSNCL